MNRKHFIRTLALGTSAGLISMKMNTLNKLADTKSTSKMPVLFLGHGSPMNAIEENEFVQGFRNISKEIEPPKAILCVSAHWETNGTYVTVMDNPRTIHDFGGFPQALFDVQYPAPGSPKLAEQTQELLLPTDVHLDDKWGLDHGAWSVIKHLYPDAKVPVVQLSLDRTKGPEYHYELAKQLRKLREKGVLIVGSGNIVHNLRRVAWDKLNESYAYDWAEQAHSVMKDRILDGNHRDLIEYQKQGTAFQLSIPTPEHYLPFLYSLSLQDKGEDIKVFNDEPVAGSLYMTSVKIG